MNLVLDKSDWRVYKGADTERSTTMDTIIKDIISITELLDPAGAAWAAECKQRRERIKNALESTTDNLNTRPDPL